MIIKRIRYCCCVYVLKFVRRKDFSQPKWIDLPFTVLCHFSLLLVYLCFTARTPILPPRHPTHKCLPSSVYEVTPSILDNTVLCQWSEIWTTGCMCMCMCLLAVVNETSAVQNSLTWLWDNLSLSRFQSLSSSSVLPEIYLSTNCRFNNTTVTVGILTPDISTPRLEVSALLATST